MPAKNAANAAHTETRQFRMHPKLLFDVINRQAGTLTKAVAEGVMNAIDAGASQVTVTLSQETVIIADDGKGFRSRDEIESFFETFGEPHREGDAVYGTFRMGRGQIFSFGVNRWASGNFEMVVDIKHKGLDYELSEGKGLSAPGCSVSIALYEPLTLLGLRTIEDELRRMVRYTETTVALNGQQISRHPGDEKWDTVTDDAYIKFGQGRLAIYNLGVFVNDHRSNTVGIGGTVVSRRQLRLNFARNDVLSDCAVWRSISALLRARARPRVLRDVPQHGRRPAAAVHGLCIRMAAAGHGAARPPRRQGHAARSRPQDPHPEGRRQGRGHTSTAADRRQAGQEADQAERQTRVRVLIGLDKD